MGRVPPEATAFPHRSAAYDVVIMPKWTNADESDAHIGWADGLWRAIQPFSSGGVYVNYLGDEGDDRVQAAYGINFPRLVKLKQQYDPAICFSAIRTSGQVHDGLVVAQGDHGNERAAVRSY